MTGFDQATEDWIEEAKAMDILDVLHRFCGNHAVKIKGSRGVGPCPTCGGENRFSINRIKNNWFCRGLGKGGDPIALVRYITGADFLSAVAEMTGRASPKGEAAQARDEAYMAAQRQKREAAAARRVADDGQYREEQIQRARAIWREAKPFSGSLAEAYLRMRGSQAPEGARLRCHPALKYWIYDDVAKSYVVAGTAPAMVARIDDNDHHFIGCHCTYLDATLNFAVNKGKAALVDPATGEILDAKKVRGSQKGGHIHLGGVAATALWLVIGEGIETVLAVREALRKAGRDLSLVLFWASVNLPNMGGPCVQSVRHPTAKIADKLGRMRVVKVRGPQPAWPEGEAVLLPPQQITEVTILGDADSDRFTTEQDLARANRRWQRPSRKIRVAWPPQGQDFDDLARSSLVLA